MADSQELMIWLIHEVEEASSEGSLFTLEAVENLWVVGVLAENDGSSEGVLEDIMFPLSYKVKGQQTYIQVESHTHPSPKLPRYLIIAFSKTPDYRPPHRITVTSTLSLVNSGRHITGSLVAIHSHKGTYSSGHNTA